MSSTPLAFRSVSTLISKVAVIDTENHSAELYAHLGAFKVLNLTGPFTPEKYIQALDVCQKAEMEVIIKSRNIDQLYCFESTKRHQ